MEGILIENLDNVLTHFNIISVKSRCGSGEGFCRLRDFTINGEDYTIEWWKNNSYLFHRNLTIPFYTVEQCNTWPNSAKLNLQFKDKYKNTVCILPIEEYE